MDYYTMSDNAIEAELGARFKSLRLRKNITQQELAENTCLSLNTIKALEQGRAKISTVIAVLRELQELQGLAAFIPTPQISPLQLAKLKGKARERARQSTRGSQGGSQGESQDESQDESQGESEW